MGDTLRREYEQILALVEKPARYLGTEHGTIRKDPRQVRLRVALAFPEVYEIAQSHLGLQLLYRLLNRRTDLYAERVYAPWPDMERELRARPLPLASLETATPLDQFNILGFSLQYELTYTNILAMLDLGRIPLRSRLRRGSDTLVIAGGPCAFNPEPLAPFLDAFLVGDGEEAVLEICDTYLRWDGKDRRRLLASLQEIAGVYVPLLYPTNPGGRLRFQCPKPTNGAPAKVRKRILTDFDKHIPEPAQIVPIVRTVHNRANVEVMRGCLKGCRFCQAGYIYRPLRERSPSALLEGACALVSNTGHDEVSLLSLSTADYSCLPGLLPRLGEEMSSRMVVTSLPSTRVDALSADIVEQLGRVRKAGVTLAPEAGTERLRRVIQKSYTEPQLLRAAERLFACGWRHLKLYFMIGLPTEADEDLAGIVALCSKLRGLARGRGQLTASASTFVPKPHTPFQWMPQIGLEETRRRQRYLAQRLAARGVRFKWHDPAQSYLEGVLSRGDRTVAEAIERAFRLGCRFDGWTDHLKLDSWKQAFAETGVGPDVYLGARALDDALAWDHIDSGVSKEFLRQELAAALAQRSTPDCALERCAGCGVCDFKETRNIVYATAAARGTECRGHHLAGERAEGTVNTALPPPARGAAPAPVPARPVQRIRVSHLKLGWSRFLGNLDLMELLTSALRRSALPLAFSAGYHPSPRISPGPALALGIESRCELLDLWMSERVSPQAAWRALNQELPPELGITAAVEVPLSARSIDSEISAFRYEVDISTLCHGLAEEAPARSRIEAFAAAPTWPLSKTTKGKTRSIDAKKGATFHWPQDSKLLLEMRFAGAKGVRPMTLLESVLRLGPRELARIRVTKVRTVMMSESNDQSTSRSAALA